ncbi:MAG TPA: nucleotide disphospho-sugar-binding domain-containing protein [Herpetosiphonaceae bacterium]
MRVLFTSHLPPHIAHEIPLLALDNLLKDTSIETAFLVPRSEHEFLKRLGARVLNVDHIGFRTEMEAYGEFSPDVVIDDASFTTGFATTLSKIPRIAIQRTGMFPGTVARNPRHRHSMRTADVKEIIKSLPDVTVLGLPQPEVFSDLFDAVLKIVPGIRSVEMLPEPVKDDPSYIFAGPLLLEDLVISKTKSASHDFDTDAARKREALEAFFEARQGQPIVYATFGTTAKATAPIPYCIRYLLSNNIAVVTNIKVDGLNPRQQALYCYQPYVPMHYVCSKVDLMIHHCGSATYQYPLLHELPTITIGTKCYDRDDVAVRLAELGASVHLPAPDEHENFVKAFQEAIQNYFDPASDFMQQKKQNIALLSAEVKQTAATFSFEDVLQRAIDLHEQAQAHTRL